MPPRIQLPNNLPPLTDEQRLRYVTRTGLLRLNNIRDDVLAGIEVPAELVTAVNEQAPDYLLQRELSDSAHSERTPPRTSAMDEQQRQQQQRGEQQQQQQEGQQTQQEAIPLTGGGSSSRAESPDLIAAREALQAAVTAKDQAIQSGATEARLQILTNAIITAENLVQSLLTSAPKRKYSWFLKDYVEEDDEYNPRNPDGTLKPLESYPVFEDTDGVKYDQNAAIPDKLQREEFFKIWRDLNEVNGKPFYDAESNALGVLPKSLYMFVPTSWNPEIRNATIVGGPSSNHNIGIVHMAGVYALAKAQWESTDEDEKIKWAVLRMEAFECGWYANQSLCTRKAAPKDSLEIFLRDWSKIHRHLDAARILCGFIPFLTEYCFRAYGSCYTGGTASEYTARAEKLMKATQNESCLGYIKPEVLYGSALRWIGVKRVMQVLVASPVNTIVPPVFRIRASSAPAGQAMITSGVRVIEALESASWWAPICQVGHYDDRLAREVAERITSSPWRYHQMAHLYGVPALNEDEKIAVQKAREFIAKVAPVLQAYLMSVMRGSDLSKVKALKKASDSSSSFYNRMRGMFLYVHKRKPKNVLEAFSAYEFDIRGPQGGEQGQA